MPRPSYFPRWIATGKRAVPSSLKQDNGWDAGEQPYNRFANEHLANTYEWLQHFDEEFRKDFLQAFPTTTVFHTAGSITSLTVLRDGFDVVKPVGSCQFDVPLHHVVPSGKSIKNLTVQMASSSTLTGLTFTLREAFSPTPLGPTAPSTLGTKSWPHTVGASVQTPPDSFFRPFRFFDPSLMPDPHAVLPAAPIGLLGDFYLSVFYSGPASTVSFRSPYLQLGVP